MSRPYWSKRSACDQRINLGIPQVITEDDKTIEFISTQTEEIITLVAANYVLALRLQEHVGELKKLEIIFRLNLRKQRRRKIKDQRKLKTKWLRSDN